MPEPVHYDMWDALAALGIAASTALATLGGLIGIQKKNGLGVKSTHDKSRAEIRELQDRCKDLENAVKNLAERLKEQTDLLRGSIHEAERKQEVFTRVVFDKLDTMGETLVAIRVAVGIAENR